MCDRVDKSLKYKQEWLAHDLTDGVSGFVSQSDDGTINPISGSKMFKILRAGGNNTYDTITQNIDCLNGREYKLTFYTSNNELSVFRVNYACVGNWGNSADCGNSEHEYKTYLTDNNVTKTAVGNGWYKIEGTFTCINDCGAKILFSPSNDNTVVYYDDVKVEDSHPETLPTPTPVVVSKPPYGKERPYPTPAPELEDILNPKPSATSTVTPTPSTTPVVTPTAKPTDSPTATPSETPNETPSGAPSEPSSPTPKVVKKLKLKKTYFVKVRGFKGKKANRVFGKHSKVKRVKIRK